MSKIFTRTYRARYADINSNGQLAPADFARYITDTAYDWGESLGLGEKSSAELGIYWVIRETEIQILAPLHFMEEFDFKIWMLEWRRVRGTRAFVVTHQGETIAQGVQQVACLDRKTQRPVSPPEELINNFRLVTPQEMTSHAFPKIPILPEKSRTLQLKVTWQDVDMLEIVNNAVYIGYAEEALTRMLATIGWSPRDFKEHGFACVIRRLHIQYHLPAVWGDILNMTTYLNQLNPSGGSFLVDMRRAYDGASIANCVLEWTLMNLDRGETQVLPESLAGALRNLVKY
jgi:YbgC/YbaW family acyl-CoA thioester hydrolase